MTLVTALLTVAVPGTPVQLPSAMACGLQVAAWKDNATANDGYVGRVGMSKATGSGVIQTLAPRAIWALPIKESGNRINVSDYAVDADAAGAKFLVSYWVN